MKLCFFADSTHPNTLNWADYFASHLGHEVSIISFNKNPTYNGPVRIISVPGNSWGKTKYFLGTNKFRKQLEKLKPDLIIGYRLESYGLVAAKSGFRPLVVAAQGQKAGANINGKIKPLQRLSAAYVARRADLILSWGEHITQDMLNLGARADKVFTMPRGVNLDLFPFHRHSKTNHEFKIITTRALVKEYCLDLLIQAVAHLESKIPNIQAVLVGDGPNRPGLEELARSLGVESRVSFVGKKSYHELSDLMRDAHLYVSTVPVDGVSSSMLEAMAFGLFPLVPDIPANRLWGTYGCEIGLYEPGSVESLAQSILLIYNNRTWNGKVLERNRSIIEERADWRKNILMINDKLTELLKHYMRY